MGMKLEMFKIFMLVAFLVIVNPGRFVHAKTIFVEPVRTIGGSSEEVGIVLEELIKSAIETKTSHEVSSSKEADWILRSKLIRLGNTLHFTVSKYAGSKVLSTRKLRTDQAEELELVVNRTVLSVLSGTRLEAEGVVGQVTSAEAIGDRHQRFGIAHWVVGLVSQFPKRNAENFTTGLYGGLNFRLDPSFDVRGFLTLAGEASSLGIGANYFFSGGDTHSLFSGGEVALPEGGGASLGMTSGLQFFRASRAHVEGMCRGGLLFQRTMNPYVGLVISIYFPAI